MFWNNKNQLSMTLCFIIGLLEIFVWRSGFISLRELIALNTTITLRTTIALKSIIPLGSVITLKTVVETIIFLEYFFGFRLRKNLTC